MHSCSQARMDTLATATIRGWARKERKLARHYLATYRAARAMAVTMKRNGEFPHQIARETAVGEAWEARSWWQTHVRRAVRLDVYLLQREAARQGQGGAQRTGVA